MKNRARIVCWIYLFLFLGVNIYLAYLHEPWRDEAQAWNLAKNSTLLGLFSDLCSEGHPALWFLFLRPIAKLGLPFWTLKYITVGLVTVALAILLFKSPMPWPANICISLCSVFWYYNTCISRVYSLVVVLAVVVMAFWKSRYERPILFGILIFLMFQSHIFMAGFAGSLLFCMAIRLVDKKKRNHKLFIGVIIAFTGMALMVVSLYQRQGTEVYLKVSKENLLDKILSGDRIDYLFSCVCSLWPLFRKVRKLVLGIVCCAIFIIYFIILAWKKERIQKVYEILVCMTLSLGYMFGIVTLVRYGVYQMRLCIILILIFTAWTLYETIPRKSIGMIAVVMVGVLSLLTIPVHFKDAKKDVMSNYSDSKDISEYMVENLPEDSVILVQYDPYVSAPYSYLSNWRKDISFVNAFNGETYSYHIWGKGLQFENAENLYALAEQIGNGKEVFYLESSHSETVVKSDDRFNLLYCTPGNSISGEDFAIYQLH